MKGALSMDWILTYAALFFLGALSGWVLELLFRNLVYHRGRWINPGFCTGPWLPIYGFGLCALYALASLEPLLPRFFQRKLILFIAMAIGMTALEYAAGLLCLRCFKLRLWDYSARLGNIQGLICPLFSLIWAALGAGYYFFVHPYLAQRLPQLLASQTVLFCLGIFWGIFLVDVAHSTQLVLKLRQIAKEIHMVVPYERLKLQIRAAQQRAPAFVRFCRPFQTETPLREHLKALRETIAARR